MTSGLMVSFCPQPEQTPSWKSSKLFQGMHAVSEAAGGERPGFLALYAQAVTERKKSIGFCLRPRSWSVGWLAWPIDWQLFCVRYGHCPLHAAYYREFQEILCLRRPLTSFQFRKY